MFLDGRKKPISPSSVRRCARSREQAHLHSSAPPNQAWQRWPQRPGRKQPEKYDSTGTGFLRFHFSNFRYSLTALSRFFASFPHGTCTLSVSHQYLAFDGIYHPLRAAIPNNSTRIHLFQGPGERESHPLCCRIPTDLAQPHNTSETTIRLFRADSHGELFSLQSPLLRESWLVSFPPLNYMLKFSGSSCLS